MKNLFLTMIFCLSVPLSIFGSPSNNDSSDRDSVQNANNQPVLRVAGTKVYNGNSLLTRIEVSNMLGIYPKTASLYNKGKNLRSTGGILIVGGIATMTGGIVLMVKGIESYTSDNGYYSYSYTGYNDKYYAGLAVMTIGELMLDGGIACSIVGKIQIKRSIRNYNTAVHSAWQGVPGDIKFQLGFLDSGNIGLRLTF